MGAFIAKQPNGLYCRYSSIVGGITHYNMTEEDYIEFCAEEARQTARLTLANRLHSFDDILSKSTPYNMSEDEFKECLRAMNDTNKVNLSMITIT